MGNLKMGLPWDAINEYALKYELDSHLIAAIICTESANRPLAVRYEPHFKWIYRTDVYAKKNHITVDTEETLQKMSWGVMQIMGALARELGHDESILKLSDVSLNISYGAKYLKRLKDKYHSVTDVIAAYNAGSPKKDVKGFYVNQSYVDKVMGYLKDLEE